MIAGRSHTSRVFSGPFRSLQSRIIRFSSSVQKELVYDRDTGIILDSSSNCPLYQSVIGIEIHAQLALPTKLFSSAPTKYHPDYDPSPNSSVTIHDLAYPGTLPLISKSAVQNAIISAAALNCEIQYLSRFERKHYSYADLPFGYQVTQQRWPIAKEGKLTCRRYEPPILKKKAQSNKRRRGDNKNTDVKKNQLSKFFSVGVDRVQIEQDTGKTTTISSESKVEYLIDFNRAGSTLIEIVFKPQINSAHEAASVVHTLQSLLKYLGTCDGKMEEGSLRCDLNVSIAPFSKDEEEMPFSDDGNDNPFQMYLPPNCGHRVEVKNLNSLRQVIRSAEFEALRQACLVMSGIPTGRETRTFDPKTGETVKIRDKGGAVDYRFMPEPDLPPLILKPNVLDCDTLDKFLETNMPELPETALERLMKNYGISEALALIITADRPAISFFEEAVEFCIAETKTSHVDHTHVSKNVANWLCNDLFALIKESAVNRNDSIEEDEDNSSSLNHPLSVQFSSVSSLQLGSLVALVLNNVLSTTQAKKILAIMYKDDLSSLPLEIADANGWKLITDLEELKVLCRNVILDPKHEEQLEQFKKGGKYVRKMTKFYTGQIMAHARGNAHPEMMSEALIQVLEEIAPGVEA